MRKTAVALSIVLLTRCGESSAPEELVVDDDALSAIPSDFLVGTWDFIGFTDDGVAAETTGTWVFEMDGTVTINGTVTFPSESTEDVSASGTYVQRHAAVVLTFQTITTNWTLVAFGDMATLTQNEPLPASTITLRRAIG